jgi:hypothetical protein
MLPGATVLYDGGILKLQILPKTIGGICNAFAPVGTLKIKLIPLVENRLQNLSIDEIFEQPEQTTQKQLTEYGFSAKMIARFYRPFLSGIFFENDLLTSDVCLIL